MPMKAQYRWTAKYPDRPNEKGSWMAKKQDVVMDFTEYIDNEEMLAAPLPGAIDSITPIPHQDPIYYLDKRLFMDDETNNANSFFIYTMKKNEWRLFRWKVQCQWAVFSLANDPAWTLHKGPWMGDFYECIKEYNELFSGNCVEMIDGCFTQGYIYFRSLMPALPSQLQ